jgi:hypothetical protein
LLGDGIERDPLDRRALLQGLLLVQQLQDVPGNGFALAIGVGRQNELVGLADGFRDLAHNFARPVVVGRPVHGEVVRRLDRAILRRQVPDVAETRDDLEARTQILVDGFRLSGGFDNYNVHWRPIAEFAGVCPRCLSAMARSRRP